MDGEENKSRDPENTIEKCANESVVVPLETPRAEHFEHFGRPHVYKSEYDNPVFTLEIPDRNGKSYTVQTQPGHTEKPNTSDSTVFELFIVKAQGIISAIWRRNRKWIKVAILVLILVAYYIYLGFALYHDFHRRHSWCDGSKLLLILTILVHVAVFYTFVVKKLLWKHLKNGLAPFKFVFRKIESIPYVNWMACAVVIAIIAIFIIVDSVNDSERLVSAGGIIVFVFISFIFSSNPSRVRWRPVIWGLLLQFIFALIILRWDFGKALFSCIGEKISAFLNFTDAGSSFVFGYLVSAELKSSKEITLPEQIPVFAFKVLSVIIFFNAATSILYYWGAMQVIVKKVGWLLNVTVGTTVAESMNAAANIFLGMTEAPLIIAPFMPKMTKSELHSVMTGGFATIAGGIMAAYISFGIKASHLLSASVMSAPAALGISKLLLPETEESFTKVDNIEIVKCEDRNMLEAVSRGAGQSAALIANIAVNLIAFLAFIAFFDSILSWVGSLVDNPELSVELILSKLFVPVALLMGVELKDSEKVAKLIGLKTIVNEFVAYSKLGEMIKEGTMSARSETIATYALCGFSNISSIGIQIGALGSLAPSKKAVLASVALRAMISGSIACFLTACIAGTLIPSVSYKAAAAINATLALNRTENLF